MKKLFVSMLMLCVMFASATDSCKATKKDGTACKAHPGKSGYCYFHNPENQCTANKKDGTRCKGIKMKNSTKCYIHSQTSK